MKRVNRVTHLPGIRLETEFNHTAPMRWICDDVVWLMIQRGRIVIVDILSDDANRIVWEVVRGCSQ